METTPNTVSELIAQQVGIEEEVNEEVNEETVEKTPEELERNEKVRKILKKIMKHEPDVGLLVAQVVCHKLAGFHRNVVEGMVEREEFDKTSMNWAIDMTTLEDACSLLDRVVL